MARKSCVVLLLAGLIGAISVWGLSQQSVDYTFEPQTPIVQQVVTFTAIVSGFEPGWIAEYRWDFDDGITAQGETAEHAFAALGDYRVRLTIVDVRGGEISRTHTVTVSAPEVDFTYAPDNPDTQDDVQFYGYATPPQGVITWAWAFGNLGGSSLQNPTQRFPEAETYRVTVTITYETGAIASISKNVIIGNAPPVADFTFSPLTPGVGDVVTFNATGSSDPDGQIVLYEWNFNREVDDMFDASGSAASTVNHVYDQPGQHLVMLRVTDDEGASTTVVYTVPVGADPPTAAFNFTPVAPKVRQTIQFNGSPSTDPDGTIVLYEWDLDGDGITDATGMTITHTYNNPDNYQVTLTVTDNDGLQDAAIRQVPVGTTPPDADFDFAPANPAIREVVTFDASDSNDPDGRIVAYEWDYPDVAGVVNDTGVSVNHAFNAAGTYRVTLTVRDDDGNQDVAINWVPVQTTPPVARITFTPATPNTGQVVTLDGSTSTDADGTIIQYQWNLGDGSANKFGTAITHAYDTPGVYPVTLMVTDNDGAIDVTTVAVPVEIGGVDGVNQLPTADFTFEPAVGPEANLNEVVTFKADGSSDPDGTIEAYEWDFDNDALYDGTGTTASHVYHTGGSKIVTLRVTDNEGGRGFRTRVVSVEFMRPTAKFTYTPASPRVGEVVSFDGSASTDEDGTVQFYEWDFDNNGTADATGMFVNHVFDVGGSQPVTLKVTDNDGVIDYTTQTVTVRINTPPTADFTHSPATPTTADTIFFSDTSKDDDKIVEWLWAFGDGTTDDVQSPSHKYDAVKTYTVELTVTDSDGATGSVTKDISVGEPANQPPVADFSYTPALPQVNKAVQFTDQSTDVDGSVSGWDWTFGDGETSTEQNPTHSYTAIGTYTVTLTVTDNEGAEGTVSKQVSVAKAGADVMTYSYPNPASTQATIVYIYPAGATDITLRVFGLTGALVFSHELSATATEYVWDLTSNGGEALANGLYFYVITAKDLGGRTIRSANFKLLIAR